MKVSGSERSAILVATDPQSFLSRSALSCLGAPVPRSGRDRRLRVAGCVVLFAYRPDSVGPVDSANGGTSKRITRLVGQMPLHDLANNIMSACLRDRILTVATNNRLFRGTKRKSANVILRGEKIDKSRSTNATPPTAAVGYDDTTS